MAEKRDWDRGDDNGRKAPSPPRAGAALRRGKQQAVADNDEDSIFSLPTTKAAAGEFCSKHGNFA